MKQFCVIAVIIASFFVDVTCRKSRDLSSANSKYHDPLSPATIMSDALPQSIEKAKEHCQKQFKWDRWNCPTRDFLNKQASTDLDRETVFVQTISLAALIYTIAKNCVHGEIKGCECNKAVEQKRNSNAVFIDSETIDCVDQVEFSEKITDSFFEEKEEQQTHVDIIDYARVHNNHAARIAIRKSMRNQCRCYGLFGSCVVKRCWRSLPDFVEVANEIRKMYDRSLLVSYDNKGQIESNIRENSLVFVFDSPNYCKENVIAGWGGVSGRQCSRTKEPNASTQERRSCRHLCRSCGFRVRKQQTIHSKRCNCKFNWCCNVSCDICQELTDEYFCY